MAEDSEEFRRMLINTLIFFLLAIHSFVPGLLLRNAIGVKGNKLLVSFALSIAILVITHFLSRATQLTTDVWLAVYYGFVLTLLIIPLIQRRYHSVNYRAVFSSILRPETVVLLVLAAVFSIYHISVGPYSEIPSDYWQHVSRVQANILKTESADLLPHGLSFFHLIRDANPFYQILALLASALELNAIQLSDSASLFFSLCFLATIYLFTYYLAQDCFESNFQRISVATISTITTFLWLGTASFSYIRYYGFAPSIVNMALLFCALRIFMDHLKGQDRHISNILFLPVLFCTMVLIHTQEALFLILLITGLSAIFYIRIRATQALGKPSEKSTLVPKIWLSSTALFWIILTGLALLHLEINKWGYTRHIVDTGHLLGIRTDLPVVNPAFRLWDTFGFFGATIVLWYLLSWRNFKSLDYINVASFIPLITCLNPAFVWLFLHFAPSTVAWRTIYLMPLGIVFGFLIVYAVLDLKKHFTLKRVIFNFAFGGIAIISLLPFTVNGYENRTSRLPSILVNENTSGYPLLKDLFHSTETLADRHNIKHFLTDSVTGFILYAGLRGEIRHWLSREYFPKNNPNFHEDLIESDFSRYLLIVNQRDGEITTNARLAGHWERDILQTSRLYPTQLEAFLRSRPDRFKLVWEHKGITTYLVQDLTQ